MVRIDHGKRIIAGLKKKPVTITDGQHKILDGLMLGDGSLAYGSMRSRQYFHGSKYPETLYKIVSDLRCFRFRFWIQKYKKIDGSIGINYHMCSPRYPELKPIYERWYRWEYDPKKGKERSIKYVPENIELHPLTLYNWYVGDGYKSGKTICFATQGFSNRCIKILQEKLLDLGMETTTRKARDIRIRNRSRSLFFEIVGPCLNPRYQYKWKDCFG